LKVCFKDRFQNELERTLHHAVTNGGNRKNADFVAPVLGNLFPPCSHGPIRLGDQFAPNLLKEVVHSAFFDRVKRNPVNARSSVVLLRHRIGFVQRLHFADMDVQSPEAMRWFSLRLDV
jgi:hypothetical protein